MTIRAFQDPQVIADITAAYSYGTMTTEDLAVHYSVSYSSMHRLLSSLGLTKQINRKSTHHKDMIAYLETLNITDVDSLRKNIITLEAAQAIFNSLPIYERTKWLHNSVQPKDVTPHATNPFAIQHSQLT